MITQALLIAGAVSVAAGVTWITGAACREVAAAWRAWRRAARAPRLRLEPGPAARFILVDELGRRSDREQRRRRRRLRFRRYRFLDARPEAPGQVRAALEAAAPRAHLGAGREEAGRGRA